MREDLRRAATFAIAAGAAFAVTAACVKAAAATVSNELIVFFRSAVSLALLLPWILRKGAAGWRTRRPGGHLWRALFGICAMYTFFYAIAHLHLAEALLLTYSTPLFIPLVAWLWIRERPPASVVPAVLVGFVGIALIIKPVSLSFFQGASLVGIASGMFAACAMVGIRRISDTEPATRIVFYFALLSTIVSAVPLLWTWVTPSAAALALLVACGAFATLGQLCLTRAYGLAPAAQIGPFTYSSVVFAGLIGWALWGEQPDRWSILGTALVVGCCVLAGRSARAAPVD